MKVKPFLHSTYLYLEFRDWPFDPCWVVGSVQPGKRNFLGDLAPYEKSLTEMFRKELKK